MDSSISFELKPKALEHSKQLLESDMPHELKEILKSAVKTNSIHLCDMIKLFEWDCENSKGNHEKSKDTRTVLPILENASMVIPEPQKRDPNPELQKRLEVLAARQANRDYNKMVENVSSVKERLTLKPKKSKSTVISGLNFAVTLFASCGATAYLLKNIVPDLGVRVGIGIAIGTVILMIEIFLAVREIERQQKTK